MTGRNFGRLTASSSPSRSPRTHTTSTTTVDAAGFAKPARIALMLAGLALLSLLFVGRVYAAPGNVAAEQKISDTAGGFTGALDNGDEFADFRGHW